MDINGIARLAGVSRATVSRYLNDGYVSEAKRAVIRRVIEETGYVPSQQAQTLRTGRTHMVGVVIPRTDSDATAQMFSGLSEVLTKHRYQVLLADTEGDRGVATEHLRLFRERNQVDGIVVIGDDISEERLREVGGKPIPMVVLGQRVVGRTCIYNDDYAAMRELVAHVLEGRSHPAYIGLGGGASSVGGQRRRAFLDASDKAGFDVPGHALTAAASSDVEDGRACCEELLGACPEMDALVCATDALAAGAMACLREHGRSVPDDVRVSGVGDTSLSRVVEPPLTTIRYHYRECGAEAARLLVEAMGHKPAAKGKARADAPVTRQTMMDYEVVERRSTR